MAIKKVIMKGPTNDLRMNLLRIFIACKYNNIGSNELLLLPIGNPESKD